MMVKKVKKWLYNWKNPFNPWKETMFMGDIPKEFPENFSRADVKIVKYGQNFIKAEVEAGGESFIVFNEPFFNGWRAAIDGKKVPLYRTNVLCMGIRVPKGKHGIMLSYRPKAFVTGSRISLLFLLVLIGIALPWNYMRKRIFKSAARA